MLDALSTAAATSMGGGGEAKAKKSNKRRFRGLNEDWFKKTFNPKGKEEMELDHKKRKEAINVDCSSDDFDLQDLNGFFRIHFEADPESPEPVEVREHIMQPKLLEEVDVTRNSLKDLTLNDLTMWSDFAKLKVIKASFNQISKVDMDLQKLSKLVLSNNDLVEFPDLDRLPSLEELDLARNNITHDSWNNVEKLSPKLCFLDVSGNRLGWKADEFLGSLQYLRTFQRKMKMFYIQDNPFVANFSHKDTGELLDYKPWLMQTLTKLQMLNGDAISKAQLAEASEQCVFPENIDLNPKTAEDANKPKAEEEASSSKKEACYGDSTKFDDLKDYIRAAQDSTDPVKAVEYIDYVMEMAVKMQTVDSKRRFTFSKKDSSSADAIFENEALVVDLCQRIVLMTEKQAYLEVALVRVLGLLGLYREGNMHKQTLPTFREMMKVSDDFEDTVLTGVAEILVPQLMLEDVEDITKDLVGEFMAELGPQEGVVKKIFPLVDKLVDTMDKMEKKDHAIAMLALASGHKESALSMKIKKVPRMIVKYIESFKGEVQKSIDYDASEIQRVKDEETELEEMKKDKRKYAEWKRENSKMKSKEQIAREEKEAVEKERGRPKMPNFARYENLREIVEKTALLDHEVRAVYQERNLHKRFNDELKDVINNNGKSFLPNDEDRIIKLLKVLRNLCFDPKVMQYYASDDCDLIDIVLDVCWRPKTHPRLLATCADTLLHVLELPGARIKLTTGEEVDSAKYYQKKISTNTSALQSFLQCLGGNRYSPLCHMVGALDQRRPIAVKLLVRDWRSEELLNSFSSVIQLMTWYGQEAQEDRKDGKINRDAMDVSNRMKNNGRSEALFTCLEVRDDELKMVTAACLSSMPVKDFELPDVTTLLRAVTRCENTSAGNMEEILAIMLEILTRLSLDESAISFEFRQLADEAVLGVMAILENNQSRDTSRNPKEAEEKAIFSFAMIKFLKGVSTWVEAAEVFKGKQISNIMVAFIECQQKFIATDGPIFIERTAIGKHVMPLLFSILRCKRQPIALGSSGNLLSGMTGIRLVQQLATVLDHSFTIDTDNMRSQLFDDRAEQDAYVLDESLHAMHNYTDIFAAMEKKDELSSFHAEHDMLMNMGGITTIATFLLDPNIAWQGDVKDGFLSRNLLQRGHKKTLDFEALRLEQILEYLKPKPEVVQSEVDRPSMSGRDSLLNMFQEEVDSVRTANMGQKLTVLDRTGIDVHTRSWPFVQGDQSKQEEAERAHREMWRCTEAFLNCIQYVMWYGTTEHKRDCATRVTTFSIISGLCKLASQANWIQFNMGSKLLQVLHSVLEIPEEEAVEEAFLLPIYDVAGQLLECVAEYVQVSYEQETTYSIEVELLVHHGVKLQTLLMKQLHFLKLSDTERIVSMLEENRQFSSSLAEEIRVSGDKMLHRWLFGELFPISILRSWIAFMIWEVSQGSVIAADDQITDEMTIQRWAIKNNVQDCMGEYLIVDEVTANMVFESLFSIELQMSAALLHTFNRQILTKWNERKYSGALSVFMLRFYPKAVERILTFHWFSAVRPLLMGGGLWRVLVVITNTAAYFMYETNVGQPGTLMQHARWPHELKIGPDDKNQYKYMGLDRLTIGFGEHMLKVSFKNEAKEVSSEVLITEDVDVVRPFCAVWGRQIHKYHNVMINARENELVVNDRVSKRAFNEKLADDEADILACMRCTELSNNTIQGSVCVFLTEKRLILFTEKESAFAELAEARLFLTCRSAHYLRSLYSTEFGTTEEATVQMSWGRPAPNPEVAVNRIHKMQWVRQHGFDDEGRIKELFALPFTLSQMQIEPLPMDSMELQAAKAKLKKDRLLFPDEVVELDSMKCLFAISVKRLMAKADPLAADTYGEEVNVKFLVDGTETIADVRHLIQENMAEQGVLAYRLQVRQKPASGQGALLEDNKLLTEYDILADAVSGGRKTGIEQVRNVVAEELIEPRVTSLLFCNDNARERFRFWLRRALGKSISGWEKLMKRKVFV